MSSSTTTTITTPQVLPRDARLIALLLAANGAEDCEEGVVRMLVEFAHRYTTDILQDSLIYAEHAKAGQVTIGAAATALAANTPLVPSLDDIRLAVQARTEGASVTKEFLLQLATTVNASPLSSIPEVYGIRLPPVASRLTAPNFSLVPKTIHEDITQTNSMGDQDGEGSLDVDEEEEEGDGLFGDDDDEDEEDAEGTGEGETEGGGDGEEEEDDDDDEEMEDVTMGGASGFMDSSTTNGGGENGLKRKAENGSDDEYD